MISPFLPVRESTTRSSRCEQNGQRTLLLRGPAAVQGDAGLLEQLARELVRVALGEDHCADPRVDEHLRADDAGLGGAVERRAVDAHAVERRLDDRVLLGVQRAAQLVALA